MTMKLIVMLLLAVSGIFLSSVTAHAQDKKPNIVIIWGDDIGQSDISAQIFLPLRHPNLGGRALVQ